MSNIECPDFLELIKRNFGYLFDLYGFETVYSKSAQGGQNCLIVLESKDCRIKFYRSQGEANLLFGTLSAPLGWEDVIDGTRHWYFARGIIDFVQKNPVNAKELLNQTRRSLTEEEQLAELSVKLKPICKQIIQLFKGDNIKQWIKEYEKFEQEQDEEFQRQFQNLS